MDYTLLLPLLDAITVGFSAVYPPAGKEMAELTEKFRRGDVTDDDKRLTIKILRDGWNRCMNMNDLDKPSMGMWIGMCVSELEDQLSDDPLGLLDSD